MSERLADERRLLLFSARELLASQHEDIDGAGQRR